MRTLNSAASTGALNEDELLMQAILDIVMGHVTMAGYHVPVPVLVFAALVFVSLITRESWWGVAGTVFVLFFSLFLPALNQF